MESPISESKHPERVSSPWVAQSTPGFTGRLHGSHGQRAGVPKRSGQAMPPRARPPVPAREAPSPALSPSQSPGPKSRPRVQPRVLAGADPRSGEEAPSPGQGGPESSPEPRPRRSRAEEPRQPGPHLPARAAKRHLGPRLEVAFEAEHPGSLAHVRTAPPRKQPGGRGTGRTGRISAPARPAQGSEDAAAGRRPEPAPGLYPPSPALGREGRQHWRGGPASPAPHPRRPLLRPLQGRPVGSKPGACTWNCRLGREDGGQPSLRARPCRRARLRRRRHGALPGGSASVRGPARRAGAWGGGR